MLVKLYPILQVFARRKEEGAACAARAEKAERAERAKEAEKTERQITHKEWINADRVVMLILVLGVIIAAIIFS